MGSDLRLTDRTRVRRKADRGGYDRAAAYAILDEALYCHIAFTVDGSPRVLPTIHTRVGDNLYVHGAAGNAMLRRASGDAGTEVCVAVTLLDGLVLSRSWFHHSMNYRSVVLFGTGQRVDDPGEKLRALGAVVDHVLAGRTAASRPPTDAEIRATLVVRIPIDEASTKIRTGPPIEDSDDLAGSALDFWAGVLPLRLQAGAPEADDLVPDHVAPPQSLVGWAR
jgi:uncharacterized protein